MAAWASSRRIGPNGGHRGWGGNSCQVGERLVLGMGRRRGAPLFSSQGRGIPDLVETFPMPSQVTGAKPGRQLKCFGVFEPQWQNMREPACLPCETDTRVQPLVLWLSTPLQAGSLCWAQSLLAQTHASVHALCPHSCH